MKGDWERAAGLLAARGYTCVLCKGEKVYTSTARGVGPLIRWLDEKTDLNGFCAADKVVGKAAAALYVLLGVAAVYAPVMSGMAVQMLEEHGIEVRYDQCVRAVRNSTDTGPCPMEEAVRYLESPREALAAIRERRKQLAAAKKECVPGQ